MQRVIATYPSYEKACDAVRALERHMSIQDIVIADRQHPAWRAFHADDAAAIRADAEFAVVMIGAPSEVARAREWIGD